MKHKDEIDDDSAISTNEIAIDGSEESTSDTVANANLQSEDLPDRIPLSATEPDTVPIEPDHIKLPAQMRPPKRPMRLSAERLFNLALTIETNDPARVFLGFFYEARLQRECRLLIPHPIPHYYTAGIQNALMVRRNNPSIFICNAIDVVLTFYLNNSTTMRLL